MRKGKGMIKKAIYPGSFDPVTYGHIDIIKRAAEVCDELIVAVLNNNSKSPLFSVDERVRMLIDVTKDLENVKVGFFSGLLVDYCREEKADVIVRGLRAITDFEYELQMAQTNRVMCPEVDTIFFTTDINYSYLSSTTVREIAGYHGDIRAFVPGIVADAIGEKVKEAK